MNKDIQFYRSILLKEMEERQMCQECGAMMERGMCTECGWMEEALVGGQKKLDVAEPKGELTAADFAKLRSMKEDDGQDHEVSMAKNSLEAIIKSAQELMMKMGSEEKDIPAWIQDHITNAENYIQQASQNYHEYETGHGNVDPELSALLERMINLSEAKKKPSAGLTKKQKSAVAKKARAGKDVGKKGKGFAAVEKNAKASGAKNPKAVAAAAMWKGVKARARK